MTIAIIFGILLIVAIIEICRLNHRLSEKQALDELKLTEYNTMLAMMRTEVDEQERKLSEISEEYEQKRAEYQQTCIDWEVKAAKGEFEARANAKAETARQKAALEAELLEHIESNRAITDELDAKLKNYREEIDGVLEPLQNLAKEDAERRYYCLDIPESDDADIKYLVENVAPHIHNANLIPKLCWTEYVSKAFNDLAAKTGIKDEAGIYKITNVNTNKCYIGKAVSVKKRLADHLKGACGMTTIADQVIHHAIVDEGFDAWTFEVICYCDKENLNDRERFYIEQFHAQEWGYNRNTGGGG